LPPTTQSRKGSMPFIGRAVNRGTSTSSRQSLPTRALGRLPQRISSIDPDHFASTPKQTLLRKALCFSDSYCKTPRRCLDHHASCQAAARGKSAIRRVRRKAKRSPGLAPHQLV
jgi:hypothetical protein